MKRGADAASDHCYKQVKIEDSSWHKLSTTANSPLVMKTGERQGSIDLRKCVYSKPSYDRTGSDIQSYGWPHNHNAECSTTCVCKTGFIALSEVCSKCILHREMIATEHFKSGFHWYKQEKQWPPHFIEAPNHTRLFFFPFSLWYHLYPVCTQSSSYITNQRTQRSRGYNMYIF